MEERIQQLERRIEELEEKNMCIGCKNKFSYELPLCENVPFVIQAGSYCPRKICTVIYQMLKDTKTD